MDGEADLSILDHLVSAEWLLLVDHCDELDPEPPMRRWFEGQFLPYLLGCFPGLRVVLAAENGPRGPAHERRSHRLRTWTAAESAEYLARRDLSDETAAQAIHEAFDGLGLFVDLARDALVEATRAGRPFDLPDVAGERTNAWLFGRLVATLPPAVQDAARTAFRLRRFTLEVLGAVGSAPDLSDVQYHTLATRGWVHRFPGGGHEVDRRIRFAYAAWCRAERPGEFTAFHAEARRVFERRGSGLDVVYHALSADPDAGITVWASEFDRADDHGRVALARVARLPEIWAWLTRRGRAAWHTRAGVTAGVDGKTAIGTSLVAQQHTQTVQRQNTETLPFPGAGRVGGVGPG
jgi:hypothetical protein